MTVVLWSGLGGLSAVGDGDNVGHVDDVVCGLNIMNILLTTLFGVWDGKSAGGEGRDSNGGAHFPRMSAVRLGWDHRSLTLL